MTFFVFFLGNFICLLVLATSDKKSSFNALLVILAVVDSFFLVFYVFDASYIDTFQQVGRIRPFFFLEKHNTNMLYPFQDLDAGPPDWYLRVFPWFLHPVKAMTMTACVYMVVAIAANRHHAICTPMLYR